MLNDWKKNILQNIRDGNWINAFILANNHY